MDKKNAKINLQSSALRFTRQVRDLNIWGKGKSYNFVLSFGECLDLINTDSKKTNFASLNYFYAQRSVASAWW
jgi:hypothetical protein